VRPSPDDRAPLDPYLRYVEGKELMKSWHMMLCAVFVVVGIVLVTAGAGAFAFLPALGCMLMMGMMIWMMVRPGGHGGH
jgi:hypothetical protein